MTRSAWEQGVLETAAGEPLLGLIRQRLLDPYRVGSSLDDRKNESPEEVFVRLAENPEFKTRLETTLEGVFDSELDVRKDQDYALVYGIALLTCFLSLPRVVEAMRAWTRKPEQKALWKHPDFFWLLFLCGAEDTLIDLPVGLVTGLQRPAP